MPDPAACAAQTLNKSGTHPQNESKASVLKLGCFCQSCKTLDLNSEHSPLSYTSDKDHIEQQGKSSPTVESSHMKRQQFFRGTALHPHLLAKSSSTLLRKQPRGKPTKAMGRGSIQWGCVRSLAGSHQVKIFQQSWHTQVWHCHLQSHMQL